MRNIVLSIFTFSAIFLGISFFYRASETPKEPKNTAKSENSAKPESSAKSKTPKKEKKTYTWAFLGDSITSGHGIEQSSAFPKLIENDLNKQGHEVKVINAAISGSTSASGPGRMKWLLKSKPDLLVLQLGANDGLRGVKISSIKSNLLKIINIAKKNNMKVLLIGMKLPVNYGKLYRDQFSEVYPKIAKEADVDYLPFIETFFKDKKYLQADGLHPSKEGHILIKTKLLDKLRKYLK